MFNNQLALIGYNATDGTLIDYVISSNSYETYSDSSLVVSHDGTAVYFTARSILGTNNVSI